MAEKAHPLSKGVALVEHSKRSQHHNLEGRLLRKANQIVVSSFGSNLCQSILIRICRADRKSVV